MLVRKLENFRATLSDIFKVLAFRPKTSISVTFIWEYSLRIGRYGQGRLTPHNFLACNVLTVNLPPFCTVARKSGLQQSHVGRRFDLHGKTRVVSLL